MTIIKVIVIAWIGKMEELILPVFRDKKHITNLGFV